MVIKNKLRNKIPTRVERLAGGRVRAQLTVNFVGALPQSAKTEDACDYRLILQFLEVRLASNGRDLTIRFAH